MKKILNKIEQVLQVVLAAPVKWPGKVANVLKYIALGLGIVEKVLEEDKPPPEKSTDENLVHTSGSKPAGSSDTLADDTRLPTMTKERSQADEME